MRTIKATFLLLLAMTLSMAVQAKKVKLCYSLEKGSEVSFELRSTQEIAQEVMGQSRSNGTSQVMVVKFKVLDLTPKGNYLISRSITKAKIIVNSPMGDLEFNTDKIEDNNPLAKPLNWLIDTALEFVMSSSGEILEIKNVEKIINEFENVFSVEGPESQMTMALAPLYNSENGIKQSLRSYLIKYPAKKVKIGDPWESVSETHFMVGFKNTANTMVSKAESGLATLTQGVGIEQLEGGDKMEMQGMEMEYELSGDKQGVFEVDLKTGLTVKGDANITIKGNLSIDSPQLPAPMSIPMTIKRTEAILRVE